MNYYKILLKFRATARGYATAHKTYKDRTNDQHSEHRLIVWPLAPNFTPYQLLEQDPKAPYDKKRFCQLAMMYHPDRWIHEKYHGVSKASRIERYRLILTAHRILSDPVKRKAYDRGGLGWDKELVSYVARAEPSFQRTAASSSNSAARGSGPEVIWENQETYWNPGSSKQQKQLFVNNRIFGLILILFVVIMTCIRFIRADHISRQSLRQRDAINAALLADLKRIYKDGHSMTRHERVEKFLNRRMGALID
ncbi:hypothetical protein F5Y10DRAFT_257355 [Nemania abortiva]|nr:hypothetical protein F5Y10DRAFT_257355 [Nemania abortiva]